MSTRYVWSRHNLAYKETQSTISSYTNILSQRAIIGSEYSFDKETGIYTITKGNTALESGSFVWSVPNVYLIPQTYSGSIMYYGINGYWIIDGSMNLHLMDQNTNIYSASNLPFSKFSSSRTDKGSLISNNTSNSQSAYPADGTQAGYYYVYLGYDTIDPASVSYSTDKPERNKPITISVTPSTGNKYGGTISYLYQYSINGGTSWTTITTTTSTSSSVTVPSTAKQFMVRVRASDNLGFTSTTYVSGANLEVRAIQGYVGINNVAKRIAKMNIGVNGIAREVTAGYIGDASGKARKWF